jgi:hypothetical protein
MPGLSIPCAVESKANKKRGNPFKRDILPGMPFLIITQNNPVLSMCPTNRYKPAQTGL